MKNRAGIAQMGGRRDGINTEHQETDHFKPIITFESVSGRSNYERSGDPVPILHDYSRERRVLTKT